jgi:hypothetical protein
MKDSIIVTVAPTPLRVVLHMGLGGTGVIVGVLLVLSVFVDRNWLMTYAWIFIANVAAIIFCTIMACLILRRPRVEISNDGFVAWSLFSSRSRRWSDIDGDFTEIELGVLPCVAYHLTQDFKDSAGIKPTKLFQGNDEAISGAFHIADLVDVLNEHKHRSSRLLKACTQRQLVARAKSGMVGAGERYRSLQSLNVYALTRWAAPFTGGSEATLPADEVFTVLIGPFDGATAVTCDPENYAALHSHFVSDAVRKRRKYRGYYLVISISDINDKCDQLES